MINRVTSTFFKEGGTLSADAPSYVIRLADSEILDAILSGKYCSVLTPRQMGKSSLMVRTARRLKSHEIRTVVIDLSQIGVEVSSSEWYLGLINWITRDLELSIDEQQWWIEKSQLSPVQRFVEFLHDVVLEVIQESVVIFIDEIDYTLNLPFTDDFFAAIRSLYNARASLPIYNRLSFVLLGVAKPSDLIKDRSRTPYNIGLSIDLTDFTSDEAKTLLPGLQYQFGDQAESILNWVLDWTNGHPYLTQKICAEIVRRNGNWNEERINALVMQLFISEEARNETNLQFIRDLLRVSTEKSRIFRLYSRILSGDTFLDDERSLVKSQLKLSGLVKSNVNRELVIRNRIYSQVFDQVWIKESSVLTSTQKLAIFTTTIAFVAILVLGYLYYVENTRPDSVRAEVFTNTFLTSESPEVRISSLAGLFQLRGYQDQARNIFFDLASNQQIEIFRGVSNPQQLNLEAYKVIQYTYQDPRIKNNSEGNQLLGEMASLLYNTKGALPGAQVLAMEIDYWTQGRSEFNRGDIYGAVDQFTLALDLNRNNPNPGMLFDRGLAFAALSEYKEALVDFQKVIELDKSREDMVKHIIDNDPGLFTYLGNNRTKYMAIAAWFPTLTPTPSPTFAPIPELTRERITTTPPLPTDSPQPLSRKVISPQNVGDLKPLLRLGTGIVNQVAYSPDGNLLAVASPTGIDFLDARSYEKISSINTDFGVLRIAFSPDSKIIASGSEDKNLRIWNVSDGTLLQTLKGHTWTIYGVDFSSDGKLLVSGAIDNTIRLWRVSDWSELLTIRGHSSDVFDVAFSPNGEIIASASRDETVALWNAKNGSLLKKLTGARGDILSVSFSPDGTMLADNGNGDIRIWSVDDGTLLRTIQTNDAMKVQFSPDGETVASGHYDGTVNLWRVYDGELVQSFKGHTYNTWSVTFSPDGSRIGTGGWDGTARIWRVSDAELLKSLDDYSGAIEVLKLSPDGSILASSTEDHKINLWSIQEKKLLWSLEGHPYTAVSMEFSPDGDLLASGSQDGTVRLWRVSDGKLMRTIDETIIHGDSLHFSSDGNTLTAVASSGSIDFWRLSDGALTRTIEGLSPYFSVAFSHSGNMLALGSWREVSLWNFLEKMEPRNLGWHQDWVWGLDFSPDDSMIASGSWDNTVRIWNVPDRTLIKVLPYHIDNVYSVAFSPSGDLLATSSWHSIHVWRTSDWLDLTTLEAHTDWVDDVTFSSDGTLLASSSSDGTIWLWGVSP
jgi:WD40 repeat protein